MKPVHESRIVTKAISKPRPLRILVLSHSHPKITNGGAEIAAFRLFSGLDQADDIQAWFLGCNNQSGAGRDGIALTQPFTEKEYVYSPDGRFDWFRFSNGDSRLPGELRALLIELQPHVVHLHHYVNFGVEVIWTIRQTLPRAKIILTLHEYQAICNHFGQMVKRGQFSLCDRSGMDVCHKCFPEIDASDFFLRERYIKTFFAMIDHFISPSEFLLNRYVDWGIDGSRISMIENIIAPSLAQSNNDVDDAKYVQPLRIGFFGQISKLKGISVLLECASILNVEKDIKAVFDIYGDYQGQPQQFQEEFLAQLQKVSSNVNYRGAYRQDEVDRLMCTVDAVLVPSIWWENSPVVIQEALRNDRPVICSNIGGMAEKVRHGVDGFHFSVGSGLELSYLIQELHDNRGILRQLRETVQRPPKADEVLAKHLELYRELAEKVDIAAKVSEGRQ